MLRRVLFSLSVVSMGLSSCGREEAATDNTNKPEATSTEVAPTTPAPKFLVVRVPVDSNGQELVESAEAREVSSSVSEFDSAETLRDNFDSSKAVTKISEELDASTSTESWGSRRFWYWNTPWYAGKLAGRGLWWGRNPYLVFAGRTFQYSYVNTFGYNQFTSWNGCGAVVTTCCYSTCGYNYHYYRY